ncbi:unnamed protein product [Schistocephalus solidus]|uniref:Transposase n=1 Tax=Schistocephalus solidus TaxID=70667 RepID=A0A183SQ21_SCHSO|nr:unnamed protein product [Schistocephalus solidus]
MPTTGFKDIKFNSVDRLINRTSHLGKYAIDEHGLPLNPCGRTGIQGRGCLRYWGPNHAADPIVSRWKVNSADKRCLHESSQRPILQFVSILRQTGQWAFPGVSHDTYDFSADSVSFNPAQIQEHLGFGGKGT